MTSEYIATCPNELIPVVSKELKELGATGITDGYMAVNFKATEEQIFNIHLKSATASQIFKVLKKCSAKTPEILYSQAKRINWPNFFGEKNLTYRIDGVAGDRGEDAMPSSKISKQTRLALEKVFAIKNKPLPKVSIKEPDLIFVVYVYKGRATISLVMSGMSLHKRGYKSGQHPAPMKETLAASILRLAGYDDSQPLLDPMCGSGTIVIEAAFQSLGKACNIHRKKESFSFEKFPDFNRTLWRKAQDDARKQKKDELTAPIWASDIEKEFTELARSNALRARVEKYINFDCKSFFDVKKPAEKGLLITNLPYGERIGPNREEDLEELKVFYKEISDHLKNEFAGWRIALIVADKSPWKSIRLKPSKKISILNGSIQTKLLIYDIREGKFK